MFAKKDIMKKQKQYCIYQDKEYERSMFAKFHKDVEKCIKALGAYKQITGEDLKPEQWRQFLAFPEACTRQAYINKVQIPDGYNPEKYIELVKRPDCSIFVEIFDKLVSPDFIEYTGSLVLISDKARDAARAKNIYLTEDKYKQYVKLQNLVKLANELQQLNSNTCNLFDTKHQDIIEYNDILQVFTIKIELLHNYFYTDSD